MDYKNSKIYAIKSDLTDKIYIGSTTQKLCKRLSQHKQDFLKNNLYKYSSIELFQLGNCYIELIELFPCSCKEELLKKEGEIIRQFKDIVINKQIAGRKQEEYYNENKEEINKKKREYMIINKEKFKEQRKNYFIEYREKSSDKRREYREKNKEKIKEQQKEYREKNKEKIKERDKKYREKKKNISV